MNELKVFQNSEFGELGILLIDGKEYFPATQCAKTLGYKNPQDAIRSKCKGVRKVLTPSNGGSQETNYIPEGDLYRLIVSSRLPAAERFERWVFDEVLPALRKNGAYGNVDLNEVIARAVTVAVNETVKALMPLITQMQTARQPQELPKKRVERKYKYRTPSKISMLPPALKETVEEMIVSNNYSCQQIANYIMNNSDIKISQMAVNRYAHQYFWL
ncbi:MAG: DUF3486 family protein [Ruminococcus sp.]|nr:DUF3486 family protein [Ruminococcus sp.]